MYNMEEYNLKMSQPVVTGATCDALLSTFDNTGDYIHDLIGVLSALQRRNFGEMQPDYEEEYCLFNLLIRQAKSVSEGISSLRAMVFDLDNSGNIDAQRARS